MSIHLEILPIPDLLTSYSMAPATEQAEHNPNRGSGYQPFPAKVAGDIHRVFECFQQIGHLFEASQRNFQEITLKINNMESRLDAILTSKEDIAIGLTDAQASVRAMYTEIMQIKESVLK